MSHINKKVPKRRFQEFNNTDDWEQRVLGENAVIKGRLGWKSLKQEEYRQDGPSMIAGKHIKKGEIDWRKVDHIPIWRYEESPEIKLENGDVIFSKDGSLGNPALITNLREMATINSTMMLVRTDNTIDSEFFYQIMTSDIFKKLVYIKVSGSSIPHLFQSDMKNFQFHSPTVEEQQKIGIFLKQLDNTIALHQRKLEKVKALKTAYLSEMFPAEGETKPKRRFAGFTDDWQEHKLGDLSEIVRGASPRPINDMKWFSDNSDVGWLRISDVTEQSGRIIYLQQKLSVAGQMKTRVLREPHLLLSIAATVGKPVVNYVNTGVHDGFLIFLVPLFDLEYMFQWLEMFKPNWQKYGQSGSQINLNSELVRNHKIFIPTIKEQQKIGTFFKQLDKTIALHQRKLKKLQNIKKAYLNEMFI
ncbi:restriction endonuclease subunit S [Listeria innocua]